MLKSVKDKILNFFNKEDKFKKKQSEDSPANSLAKGDPSFHKKYIYHRRSQRKRRKLARQTGKYKKLY